MRRSEHVLSALRGSLPALSIVICVLQPLLDVLSYWQIQLELPNYLTLGVRIVMIGLMLLAALPLLRNKKVFFGLALVMLLYLTGHVLACLRVSAAYDWKEDLSDQARLLMLPATAFCFAVFLRENESVFSALKRGLMINFVLILLVMLLSVVTGSDPHTYASKEIGVRGWFFWTSAQSAILSLLCPATLAWALERFDGKLVPLAVACLLSFGALFAFGTRLAYAALAAVGVCMTACLLISDRKSWKQALTVFVCAALFLALYPLSPMARNQSEIQQNAKIKQARIDEAAADSAEQRGLDPAAAKENPDLLMLAAAYHYNLQGMIDQFGIERVADVYHHSLDVVRICDDRVRKLNYCRLLMEDSAAQTPLARWFGLEIGRTHVVETEVYVFETDEWVRQAEASDPENDFYGVYYLCGIVGLGLLLLFLGFFASHAARMLFRVPKRAFAPRTAAFLIAFAIALAYAWSTVSVLRRNNASFYFAVVLACIWYLSREARLNQKNKEFHS